jgi:hypothetical protein
MSTEGFVPPEPHGTSMRERLVAAAVGAAVGALVSLAGWYVTADVTWFYAVPVAAIICAWGADYRPRVLWWRRGT